MLNLRLWVLLILLFSPLVSAAANKVWLLEIRGPIGVASMEYLVSAIDSATIMGPENRPQVIILRMDTPGGLDNAMRQMIQRILSSTIPIVGYVTPQGARAASAGTYLLYASHIAAMAPATNLGAATPVQLGGPQTPAKSDDEEQDSGEPISTMQQKIINDATAYIEGLADLRGRNRQWAAEAVRSGASLSAAEALEKQVINLVAQDIEDLLQQLDGMTVAMPGQELTLHTLDAQIVIKDATWRQQFLAVISNPSIAYVLMMIGVYGLIFEFSNPGGGVLGITGAICILLALYAFQVLPVNYVGVACILLGIGLMVAEAFLPSFGFFGIIGATVLVLGSVILIDTPEPALQIAWPVIAAVAIASASFSFLAISMLLKNRQKKIRTGVTSLIGTYAEVELLRNSHAMVRLQGELWQAQATTPLKPGDKVMILSINGLTLNVRKLSEVANG